MERFESDRGPIDDEPDAGSSSTGPSSPDASSAQNHSEQDSISPDEQISEARLYAAVEASLTAMEELADEGRFSPTQIHGSSMQPDYLAEFTRFEIEEAEAFLRRMGMIVTVEKPRST